MPHVPGTIILNDEAAHTEQVTAGLKHGTGRNAHIVLAPQPSEDPNDPLNWSKFKKEYVTWILLFGSILNAATNGPFLNASYVVIANDVNYPLNQIVLVSGYNLLAAGASGPIWCALSRRYGKRPCFLPPLSSISLELQSARLELRTNTFSPLEFFKASPPVPMNHSSLPPSEIYTLSTNEACVSLSSIGFSTRSPVLLPSSLVK